MFDFHIHIDPFGLNGLLPSEALGLAGQVGLKSIGLIARLDLLGLPLIFPRLNEICHQGSLYTPVEAYAGVELINIVPALYPDAVAMARELGVRLILGHGEGASLSYQGPAMQGTNLAAILAGVDILAHPGLITFTDVQAAAQQGVALELSLSQDYSLTNAHIAKLAQEQQVPLLIGSNAKTKADFHPMQLTRMQLAAQGALVDPQIIYQSAQHLIEKLRKPTYKG